MAENILINFTASAEGLKPGMDGLDLLTEKERELAQTAIKSSADQDNAHKRIASSVEKLVNASKSLDKSIIGGAYKDYLKAIQKELGLTQQELIKYVASAKRATQQEIMNPETEENLNELQIGLEVINEQLKRMIEEEQAAADASNTFTSIIRMMTNDLNEMKLAGQEGTEEFAALQQRLVEMKKTATDTNKELKVLGSDSRHLEALIGIASGVAGGFAIMQGAAALFGDESEDVQRALVKLNAAMSILQGLQQINNLLQKESAASILLSRNAKVADTAATQGATVAQHGLNAAMKANPVGLLIVGITALVTAMSIFTGESEDNTEALLAQNKALEDQIDFVLDLKAAYEKIGNSPSNPFVGQVLSLEKELALMKSKGASQADILKKEQEILQAKRDQVNIDFKGIELDERIQQGREGILDATQDNTQLIGNLLTAIQKTRQEITFIQSNSDKLTKDEENRLKVLDSSLGLYMRRLNLLTDSKNAVRDGDIAILDGLAKQRKYYEDLATERAKKEKEIAERNAQALFEIEKRHLERIRDMHLEQSESDTWSGSFRLKALETSFQAQLRLFDVQQARELQKENITAAEKRNIFDKYAKLREDAEYEHGERKLKIIQDAANKEKAVMDQMQADLLAQQQKRSSDAEKGVNDLFKITSINARNSLSGQLKQAEEEFKSGLLTLEDYQKKREEILAKGRANEINNEISRITAIIAIRKQYGEDTTELEQQLFQLQEQLRALDLEEFIKNENKKREEMMKTARLREQITQMLISSIEKTVENEAAKGALTGMLDLYNQIRAIQQSTMDDAEKTAAILQAGIMSAQGMLDSYFAQGMADRQEALQHQLNLLDEARQKELDNENLTRQQKADIDARYRARERQIKLQAFEAEKEAKKTQAIINGFLAVTNVLATAPFPSWPFAIGAAALTTGLQVAAINREKPPKFAKGKVKIEGPGTTTSDSIHALISRGESVINAKATEKWTDALQAINDNQFEKYLAQKYEEMYNPDIPDEVRDYRPGIDYTLLAKEVAKELKGVIPAPAQVHNKIDRNGFRQFIVDQNNTTEFKNQRYSMS